MAVALALPLAALPASAVVPGAAATDCADCPLMAAQGAQGEHGGRHAAPAEPAARRPAQPSGCHREPQPAAPAAPDAGWGCCDLSSAPAVPFDEAVPRVEQTLSAPVVAGVAVPAPAAPRVPAGGGRDAPDPPHRDLFLLHASFLN